MHPHSYHQHTNLNDEFGVRTCTKNAVRTHLDTSRGTNEFIPPHQGSGAGIAIKGDAWVSGWYPAATELNILKKVYSSQKNIVSF